MLYLRTTSVHGSGSLTVYGGYLASQITAGNAGSL